MANFYLGDIVDEERREPKKTEEQSKPESQKKYVQLYQHPGHIVYLHVTAVIFVNLPPEIFDQR